MGDDLDAVDDVGLDSGSSGMEEDGGTQLVQQYERELTRMARQLEDLMTRGAGGDCSGAGSGAGSSGGGGGGGRKVVEAAQAPMSAPSVTATGPPLPPAPTPVATSVVGESSGYRYGAPPSSSPGTTYRTHAVAVTPVQRTPSLPLTPPGPSPPVAPPPESPPASGKQVKWQATPEPPQWSGRSPNPSTPVTSASATPTHETAEASQSTASQRWSQAKQNMPVTPVANTKIAEMAKSAKSAMSNMARSPR